MRHGRMHKFGFRALLLGVCALLAFVGPTAGSAESAIALPGAQPARTYDEHNAHGWSTVAADHSYQKHVIDQNECVTYLNRQCTFDEWRGFIFEAIMRPDDSFAQSNLHGTGYAADIYWRRTGVGPFDGMIVILNRHQPFQSTAYFAQYRQYEYLAQRARPAGAAACGTSARSASAAVGVNESMPLANARPALDATASTVYAVGQDGNMGALLLGGTNQWIKDYRSPDCNTASVTLATSKTRGTEIYARSLDGELRRRKAIKDPWESLGRPQSNISIMTTPVAETHYSRSSANNEALSVWVVDGDGKMWERTEAQWIGPYSLSTGRRIVSAPSVTGYPNNPMARSVFVVDSGGDLRQAYTSDGSDWSWFNLGNAGTKLLGSPVHLWGASNAESVFAVDDKGDLQEIHWDGSGSVGRWINHGRGDAALLVGESPGGYYSKALGDDVVFLVDENGNFMRFNSFQGWSNLGNGGAKFVSQAAGVELAIFLLVDENGDLQRYLTTWENLSHP